MDYELAKQLKDAGFPQELTDPSSYWVRAESPCFGWSEGEDKPYGEYVKRPTLSELIEAFPKEYPTFTNLEKVHDDWWIARADTVENGEKIIGWKSEHGRTPLEAVACLWLALHPVKEVC